MSGADDHQLDDAAAIKALANPVRLAIVEHLMRTQEPASATDLADVAGLSVSATSWHLRMLAGVGVLEQAQGRGDGRERLWAAVGSGLLIERDGEQDAERDDAVREYLGVVVARAEERLRTWLGAPESRDGTWADALRVSDSTLQLTRDELAELNAAYDELVRPYLARDRSDPPAEAREVSLHLRIVPTPGAEGET